MRIALAAATSLLLALPTIPFDAEGQTGPGSIVLVKPTRIDVNALPGRDNGIIITSANGLVTIVDGAGGAFLADPAAPGCSQAGNAVTCPTPPKFRVKLSDGNDTFVNLTAVPVLAKGGTGNDALYGGSAKDTLIGDSGDDTIVGGGGDDDIRGSTGNDVLEGGTGADKLNGQGGVDTVKYRDPATWPSVTRDRVADDGEPGERDNVLPSVEKVDVSPFNYRADDTVLPAGGTLPVADDTWVASGDFDLETRREVGIQAVGYYDADGRMRVAARRIGEANWVRTPPLTTVHAKNWDLHRYFDLAFDPDGRLHVVGNLHGIESDPSPIIVVCCSPLQYFRTPDPVDDPADVLTLARSGMLSPDPSNPLPQEDVATYPTFLSDGGRFFFSYRDGSSNFAEWYVHQLDRATGRWFNPNGGKPWYSGWQGLVQPDPGGAIHPHATGFYHFYEWDWDRFHVFGYDAWFNAWGCDAGTDAVDGRCFRTYVWTRDFAHFYDAAGVALPTPIEPQTRTPASLVDDAPFGGSWGGEAAFDDQGRPMMVYGRHAASRLDAGGKREGNFQAYFARWDGTAWRRTQLSDWPQWIRRSPDLGVIGSIVGPVADANGVPRWYVRVTVFDEPPNTRSTGWLQIDLDTLATTPAPAFQPPASGACKTGTSNMQQPPVQFPDWSEPGTGTVLVPRVRRSNVRIGGLGDEAGDFYYLSWNVVSREPPSPMAIDPPRVALSLRRTSCVK